MDKETVYIRVALQELSTLIARMAIRLAHVVDSPKEALIELRVAIEELYTVAKSTKAECRSKLGQEFVSLGAVSFLQGVSLIASDEYDVIRAAQREKPPEEPLLGNTQPPSKKSKAKKKKAAELVAQ